MEIENGVVSTIPEKYKRGNGDYEIHISKNTLVTEGVSDHIALRQHLKNFDLLKDIGNGTLVGMYKQMEYISVV